MSGNLAWFGGDRNGLEIFDAMIELGHTWDNLIDKDKPVTDAQINSAFYTALVRLPLNPLYASVQHKIIPLWVAVINAYEVSNGFEKAGAVDGLAISYGLRSSMVHIVCYLITVCAGADHARKVMPDVWKHVIEEDFNGYIQEHKL